MMFTQRHSIRGVVTSFRTAVAICAAAIVLSPMMARAQDDYPSQYRPSALYDTPDAWGMLMQECTSFVAWRMNRDAGVTSLLSPASAYPFNNFMTGNTQLTKLGNAGGWWQKLSEKGYAVDSTPEVGDIAEFEYPGKPIGHVAYVSRVNADNSVDVEEYNYHSDPTSPSYSPGTYSARQGLRADHYIHFNKRPRPTITKVTHQQATNGYDLFLIGRRFTNAIVRVFRKGAQDAIGFACHIVSNPTPTSFTVHLCNVSPIVGAVVAALDAETFVISVQNEDGTLSEPFDYQPSAAPSPSGPSIAAISPSSLTASAFSQSFVVSGSGFATGFNLIATVPGGGSVTVPAGNMSSSSSSAVTVTAAIATPGDYGFRVVNPGGLSSNTAVLTVRSSLPGSPTPCVAPDPPSSMAAQSTGSSVLFSWVAPVGSTVTSYILEAGTASGQQNAGIFDLGSVATSYTATNVPVGKYFVRVRSKNSCGTSSSSNEVVVAIGSGVPTPAPTPLPGPAPRTFSAYGVVSDASTGRPIPAVNYQIIDGTNRGTHGTTAADGVYVLQNIQAGTFTVEFTHPSYQVMRQVATMTADIRFDVTLQPLGNTAPIPTPTPQTFTAYGIVSDAFTGRPIPAVNYQIIDGTNRGTHGTTAADGVYVLQNIQAGAFTVEFTHPSYQVMRQLATITGDTRFDLALQPLANTPAPPTAPTPNGAPPSVTTTAATSVGTSTAIVAGIVNPNGLSTSVVFQWGTTTAYSNTTAAQSIAGSSSTNITFALFGLSAGTSYHYRVVATSSAGTIAGGDLTFTTTTLAGNVPTIPTNPSPGTTASPGPTTFVVTVTLTWNASSGATSYGVGVRDLTTNLLVVDTTTSATAFTTTLTGGRPYRWNVNACNATGCSDYTTPLYFQTPASVTVPGIPTSPSPGIVSSPGPVTSSTTVTLTWNGSSGASYYGLGVRDLTTNLLVVDTNVSGTSFSASLIAGRPYRWNVDACNTAGCSGYTTVLYFQTPTTFTTPGTPANPSPGTTSSPGPTVSSSTVILSWSTSSGATYYGLGVRDLTTNQLVVDTNVSGTSFSAGLVAGRPYRWNVNACNAAGCSGYTTVLYFQTPR